MLQPALLARKPFDASNQMRRGITRLATDLLVELLALVNLPASLFQHSRKQLHLDSRKGHCNGFGGIAVPAWVEGDLAIPRHDMNDGKPAFIEVTSPGEEC